MPSGTQHYHLVTLGCPKNEVDSDKLAGTLAADGMVATDDPRAADLIIVNTCAFIEEARQESVDTILALADARRDGAELVVTGCLAERYGDELAGSLPEVDRVAGFGVPVALGATRGAGAALPEMDLLNLPRPAATRPWAYVKVAEGCDRRCGFCAIPSFRGPQRSRRVDDILTEVEHLDVREVVLVAQDLASYGRDDGRPGAIVPLVEAVTERVDRVRLLYLYPSDLTDRLADAILATEVPYFDLSLQHVSPGLLRRMRRWGSGDRFLERIAAIRDRRPDAAFRSNFIVGYPGETEDDHAGLVAFIEAAQLDWSGFFPFSEEAGTYAAALDGRVEPALVLERMAELTELQDGITARRRLDLVGRRIGVLVDTPGVGRSHREAPEIDGVVHLPTDMVPGVIADVRVKAAIGPDLVAGPE